MTLSGWTRAFEIAASVLRSWGWGLLIASLAMVLLGGALSLLHGDETPSEIPLNLFWLTVIAGGVGSLLLALGFLLTWLGHISSR